MRMKLGILGLAMLVGGVSTGCNTDWWYDSWYDTTPDLEAPGPSYNSSYLTFDKAYLEAAYLGCADGVHAWYTYAEFSGAASDATALVTFDDQVVPPDYVEFNGGFAEDGASSCVCEVYSEQGDFCDGDYTGNEGRLETCASGLPFFDYLYTEHYLTADCELEINSDFAFTLIVSDFSDGSTATVTFGEGSELRYTE